MKRKIDLLMIFTFFIVFTFLFSCAKYLRNIEYTNYAVNDYFSQYSLDLKNDDELSNFITQLTAEKRDISISLVNDDTNIIKRINFNNAHKPEMVAGRFFDENDMNNNRLAVVCEDREDIRVGSLLDVNGFEYEVIGLFKKTGLSSDDIIFLNMNESDLKYAPTVIIDFNNNALFQTASNNPSLTIVNRSSVVFSNALPQKTIFTLVGLLFCLSVLVIMYFFTEEKKEEIKLKYIFGYAYAKIYTDIYIRIVGFVFMSWLSAFIIFGNGIKDFIFLIIALVICSCSLFMPLNETIKAIKLEKNYE